jgi:hypothetical protein
MPRKRVDVSEDKVIRSEQAEQRGITPDAALTAGAILAAPVVNAWAQAHFGQNPPPPPPPAEPAPGNESE